MIEIMAVIDNILKLAPVRWGLLAASVLLSIAVSVQTLRLKTVENQLEAEVGRNASLSAAIDVQNAAIKKAGDDMEKVKKRLQTANQKANEIRKKLEARKVEIKEIVLEGDCPQMVQQVINEVRK